jgi:hypothetical protein
MVVPTDISTTATPCCERPVADGVALVERSRVGDKDVKYRHGDIMQVLKRIFLGRLA